VKPSSQSALSRRSVPPRVSSWLAPKQVADVQHDPRTLSLAFALLFGSGGLMVLFTLLLPHSPDRNLLGLIGPAIAAERMREATPSVAWSAGVAVWDGEEHAGALVRRADSLLYEAKRGGRNRAAADPSTG